MPYFRALKSYSYRNAPQKLIPAIIACKCVPYLIVLGFFICLSGFIPLLANRKFGANPIETNETSIVSDDELNITISHDNESWRQDDVNVICK